MKIITFAAIKGGVGKTTLAFNFGEWLSRKQKNVLFIDLDHQCNLSQTYDVYDNENTVGNIFLNEGTVNIHEITKNISLIAGDMHLDVIEKEIENRTNKNMLIYMWLSDNYVRLNLERFDYIIFDCHPDFSTATKNAVIVSNYLLSPITPSEHGYNAKFNLEERLAELKDEAINFETRESYLTVDTFFIANMVKRNTRSSHDFLEAIKKENDVLTIIPEREIFNKTTLEKKSLSTMKEDANIYLKNKKLFDEINNSFEIIENTIN